MILGECGLCGGDVFIPDHWHGMFPPVPFCQRCGAKPVGSHRPIIPMIKETQQYQIVTNNKTSLEHV